MYVNLCKTRSKLILHKVKCFHGRFHSVQLTDVFSDDEYCIHVAWQFVRQFLRTFTIASYILQLTTIIFVPGLNFVFMKINCAQV